MKSLKMIKKKKHFKSTPKHVTVQVKNFNYIPKFVLNNYFDLILLQEC